MTTTEALDQLSAEIPGYKSSVYQGEHYNPEATPEYRRKHMFEVYLHIGEKCHRFESPDGFDKPVADCLALAKSVAATENRE